MELVALIFTGLLLYAVIASAISGELRYSRPTAHFSRRDNPRRFWMLWTYFTVLAIALAIGVWWSVLKK
jgi:hypothetical protein